MTATQYPATCYVVDPLDGRAPMLIEIRPRQRVVCQDCGKWRTASQCIVRVYLRTVVCVCGKGHGCRA